MYTKEKTALEIQSAYPYVQQIEVATRAIKRENGRLKRIRYIPKDYNDFKKSYSSDIVWVSILLCLFFSIYFCVLNYKLSYGAASAGSFFLYFALGIPVGIAVYKFVAVRIYYIITKFIDIQKNALAESYNSKIQDDVNKAVAYHQSSADEAAKVLYETEIPGKYLNTAILSKFMDYLKSFKADNFRECVLLLEQEERNNAHLRQLQGLESEMRRIKSQLSHANEEPSGLFKVITAEEIERSTQETFATNARRHGDDRDKVKFYDDKLGRSTLEREKEDKKWDYNQDKDKMGHNL